MTIAFYKWKRRPFSDRDWDDAHLINAAVDIHHDDPMFGYRFIADELAHHGIAAGWAAGALTISSTVTSPPRISTRCG